MFNKKAAVRATIHKSKIFFFFLIKPLMKNFSVHIQLTFTCPKPIIETLETFVKYV